MSQAVRLLASNLPGYTTRVPANTGYGLSEGGCLPCLGVSGRAVAVSSCSSCCDLRICKVKVGAVKCVSEGASFVCRASSGGHRRNPDFSRQSRNRFRGRNKRNEERVSFDDESEVLSSKNGPLLSLSSSPKFQATATPGPREKEIVELFRKVQAQLRERAAAKEDKKLEAMQGQRKESETVDSLLKLLRKHSAEQSKRKNSTSSSKDVILDQTEQEVVCNEDKSTGLFDSSVKAKPEVQELNSTSLTRPASNFRRKSPVTQFKYQPIYPSEETSNSISNINTSGKINMNSIEIPTNSTQEPEAELELESESEPEHEAIFADGDLYDEASNSESILDASVYDELSDIKSNILDDNVYEVSGVESSDIDNADNNEDEKREDVDHSNLSALKLVELRALAKSRGVKGFSKMKKGDLVELLGGSSV